MMYKEAIARQDGLQCIWSARGGTVSTYSGVIDDIYALTFPGVVVMVWCTQYVGNVPHPICGEMIDI